MKTALALCLAALLAGCSSFKLGAICYLPANHTGSCEVAPK